LSSKCQYKYLKAPIVVESPQLQRLHFEA